MDDVCAYCPKLAAFRLDGWVSDGEIDGPVYQLVCTDHVGQFRDWDGNDPLHGFDYLTGITPIDQTPE